MFFGWNHFCQKCRHGMHLSNYSHNFLKLSHNYNALHWFSKKPILPLSNVCISNGCCSTFPLCAGMLNDMQIKVIFETLTVWHVKSPMKVMSPAVFIKLPSTVIVSLCEFLLCHQFVFCPYPQLLFVALTVIPVLKWQQDFQKWGGMIVIYLDNTWKHGLNSK